MKNKKQLDGVFAGFHNSDLEKSRSRMLSGRSYADLSTIWVTPLPGRPAMLPAKVVFQSWMNLMMPMNQRFFRLPIEGMEVGEAYNSAVQMILAHPLLSKFKYMLTIEWDNMPPPDGLLKLYESMDKFDVVGGLYWTKGEGGMPMCYGDPKAIPKNFIPQLPPQEAVTEFNGLGMGFNLFKIDMFKRLPAPWFKTIQEYTPGVGSRGYTQDLWFYENAGREGFRFACDSRVKVGHLDVESGTVW